jgi:hypothetical protein
MLTTSLLALALAAACSSSSGGGSKDAGGDTDTDTDADGGLLEEICTCAEAAMEAGEHTDETCGLESPCAPASFDLDVYDEAAIDCVLEGMQDGAAAFYALTSDAASQGQGCEVECLYRFYYLLGDGTVILQESIFENSVLEVGLPLRFTLRPESYFEDCLADESAEARYNCIYLCWDSTVDTEQCP